MISAKELNDMSISTEEALKEIERLAVIESKNKRQYITWKIKGDVAEIIRELKSLGYTTERSYDDLIIGWIPTTDKPISMKYTGYSSRDCESWYECPRCKHPYGSWEFRDFEDVFKCKNCDQLLKKPQ